MDHRSVLLDVKDLKTHFFLDEGTVRAVDGASFKIHSGETLGVVGESGCGKSMTARSILQIVRPPGRIVSGTILWHGSILKVTRCAVSAARRSRWSFRSR
jgi:ABC-type dipeptide/oligopeptide/nickel transport system ATPase component